MQIYDFTYYDVSNSPRQAIGEGETEIEALRNALSGKSLPTNIGGYIHGSHYTADQLTVSEAGDVLDRWLVTFGSGDQAGSVMIKRGRIVRGPGRPEGSTIPDADKRKGHEITLSDEAWKKAVATGNASQYIESLILGK